MTKTPNCYPVTQRTVQLHEAPEAATHGLTHFLQMTSHEHHTGYPMLIARTSKDIPFALPKPGSSSKGMKMKDIKNYHPEHDEGQ